MSIPTLKKQASGTVLMLHDKPYIMLAGEVGNSNSSSVEYMEGVWQTAEQLGMNTLLLPITWDQVEPEEGQFDFSLLDGLVLQARGKGKHLVLLWFGSWKNAECMYAPAWVKTDLQRFRRGQIVKGKNKAPRENAYGMLYTTLSYLCEETCAADARAFGRLMRHLRTLDGEENTVLAVQVENETGLLGTARERSDEADVAFAADVPQDFAEYMFSYRNNGAGRAGGCRERCNLRQLGRSIWLSCRGNFQCILYLTLCQPCCSGRKKGISIAHDCKLLVGQGRRTGHLSQRWAGFPYV